MRGPVDGVVGVILEHPALRGVRTWLLTTGDAHDVYRKLGFAPVTADRAAMYMERRADPPGDGAGGPVGNPEVTA